jgi:hypothetical protein
MKTAGIIILVLGVAGTVFFGIKAVNNSDAFSFLGIDVAVSSANWTPVIISVVLIIAGLFMMRSKK